MTFNPDNKVVQFLSKIADIMEAFILGMICSVAIITIGASFTAMHKTMIDINLERKSSVHKTFFCSFKENFKLSSLIWLTFLAIAFVLYVNVSICWGYVGSNYKMADVCKAFTLVLIATWFVVLTYGFAGLAIYKVSYKQAIKNACLYSIGKLGYSILILLIWFVSVFCFFAVLWYAFFIVPFLFYLLNRILITAMMGKDALKLLDESKEPIYYE